jgi:hypothetical protein
MTTNKGCYQCRERKPHCHSSCETYRERKETNDAKQALIREKKSREHEATSVEVAAKLKALKRRGE